MSAISVIAALALAGIVIVMRDFRRFRRQRKLLSDPAFVKRLQSLKRVLGSGNEKGPLGE